MKVFGYLLILVFIFVSSASYAEIGYGENIITILKGETTGRIDINYDGKIETVIIEKDTEVPGVITKLVILDEKGIPLFYLNNLPPFVVYCGLKDLERKEKNINRMYHKYFYEYFEKDKRKDISIHASPGEVRRVREKKIPVKRPKKTGNKSLDEFEERVIDIWIKTKKLEEAGPLSGGREEVYFKVYPNKNAEGEGYLTIVMLGKERKRGAEDRDYIWDTKTKSYMDIHKYLSREHPDYPF